MDLDLINFLYKLFLTCRDFLSAGVIQGLDLSFNSFLDNCLTGICLSMILETFE